MQIKDFNKNFEKYAFLLIFLIYGFFSFYRLGQIIFNVDAQHWYLRSTNFIEAIKDFEREQTYQDPKPGVSLMWLSGTSIDLAKTLYKFKNGPSYTPDIYVFDDFYLLNFAAKAPLVATALVFLIFYYFLLANLFSDKPLLALISAMLLAFEPYYIGITRFLHVDSLLTFFMVASVLTLFVYLKENKPLYLILSGVLAGLACLTKSQGFFLFPFTLIIWILERKNLKFFTVFTLIAGLAYFLLFPAMWVAPVGTFKNIITEAFFVTSTGNTSIQPIHYYFSAFLNIFSPVTLLFLITGIYFLFTKRNKYIFFLFCYLILYFIGISIIKQKIDRYLLPVFPVVALISAYGTWNLVQNLTQIKKVAVIITVFLAGFIYAVSFFPHFVTAGGGGEDKNYYGSLYNEVGEYLNAKPNAMELKVVTMTKAYALRPFVKGKTFGYEEPLPQGWTAEYFVTNDYWNSVYGVPETYKKCKLEKSIYFKSQKYWDIHKCK